MTAALLELRHLEVAFGGVKAVDGVSFVAQPGEIVGIIGPNGSGKTELMRVLAGTRDPDQGELVVGPRVSPGFFTQLQSRADLAGTVVLDAVRRRVGGGSVQAAMGALARYGLAEAARRSYDVLSGGEKARLEVLVLELEGHNLLLLDEPTDNLDLDSSDALEQALDASTERWWLCLTTAPSCVPWTAS